MCEQPKTFGAPNRCLSPFWKHLQILSSDSGVFFSRKRFSTMEWVRGRWKQRFRQPASSCLIKVRYFACFYLLSIFDLPSSASSEEHTRRLYKTLEASWVRNKDANMRGVSREGGIWGIYLGRGKQAETSNMQK